jgi:hypothetical protein
MMIVHNQQDTEPPHGFDMHKKAAFWAKRGCFWVDFGPNSRVGNTALHVLAGLRASIPPKSAQ